MNSWQQPVAGEPSLGTPHHHVPTDDNYVYTNTTPSANTWYDVDLTSILTAGTTKAAFITLYIATDICFVYFAKANTETIGIRCNYGRWNAADRRQVLIPVNDSGHVYIAVSDADADIYIEKLCFPVS